MFTFSPFLSQVGGKCRVPAADVFGGVIEGVAKIAGAALLHVRIDRYYKVKKVERVDLDFIAKVCFVLDCQVEDLLEYEKP